MHSIVSKPFESRIILLIVVAICTVFGAVFGLALGDAVKILSPEQVNMPDLANASNEVYFEEPDASDQIEDYKALLSEFSTKFSTYNNIIDDYYADGRYEDCAVAAEAMSDVSRSYASQMEQLEVQDDFEEVIIYTVAGMKSIGMSFDAKEKAYTAASEGDLEKAGDLLKTSNAYTNDAILQVNMAEEIFDLVTAYQ